MSYVYIFENQLTNEYKVGCTRRDPKIRLKESQTFNAQNLKLIDVFKSDLYKQIETSLHNHYKMFHINREWFKLDRNAINNFQILCKKIENSLRAYNEFVFD
jgi:hypothetical protein